MIYYQDLVLSFIDELGTDDNIYNSSDHKGGNVMD